VLALHLAAVPRYIPLTRVLLGGLAEGAFEGRTSSLTLYQLLAEPHRRGREDTAARVEACIAALPGLQVEPLTATIAGQAAAVRAQIGGSFERAAQIATALAGDAELFVTQRSTLRRIAGLGVEQLDTHATG
jgi:predicted nucleic acid-binding protein